MARIVSAPDDTGVTTQAHPHARAARRTHVAVRGSAAWEGSSSMGAGGLAFKTISETAATNSSHSTNASTSEFIVDPDPDDDSETCSIDH
jgi:hypothetical protein